MRITRILAAAIAIALSSAPAFAEEITRFIDDTGKPVVVTPTVPLPITGATVIRGGATVVTGQVSVGTTSTLVVAQRAGRQKLGITVVSATQCAFGPSGVTLSTGWPLAAIAYVADSWDTSAAIYGVCAAAATIVGFREQF